uniref:Uncharacterized protein n=1 Tax=Coturnix japonica TaxID=93934 RepID=A0A8C2SRH5_COTJA
MGHSGVALWGPQFIECTVAAVITGANFPKKRKRSRWNQDSLDQKTVIPGMPTVIPPGLTREQERAYIGNHSGVDFGVKKVEFWGKKGRIFGVKKAEFWGEKSRIWGCIDFIY